jgi:hypothetical protein
MHCVLYCVRVGWFLKIHTYLQKLHPYYCASYCTLLVKHNIMGVMFWLMGAYALYIFKYIFHIF